MKQPLSKMTLLNCFSSFINIQFAESDLLTRRNYFLAFDCALELIVMNTLAVSELCHILFVLPCLPSGSGDVAVDVGRVHKYGR